MAKEMPYEQVGSPIIGRVITVPTATKDKWLKLLNGCRDINAGPIATLSVSQMTEILVHKTYILVSMEQPYDRPLCSQVRLRVMDPPAVTRYIDEIIRLVGEKLSQ